MAAIQYQAPPDVYVNETGTRQYLIPGGIYINETVSVTPPAGSTSQYLSLLGCGS